MVTGEQFAFLCVFATVPGANTNSGVYFITHNLPLGLSKNEALAFRKGDT